MKPLLPLLALFVAAPAAQVPPSATPPSATPPVAAPGSATTAPLPVLVARIVHRFPHDPTAFTEGLLWHGGIAHRWDVRTLRPVGGGHFVGEGWGLASDGTALIHSDGTPTLRFLDPATLAMRRQVTVTLGDKPVRDINELEVVDGQILANVWHTPYLLRIDPTDGHVTAIIDLRAVVAEVKATDPEAVANGIAWDASTRRLFVTGKLWPTLFEVVLAPRAAS